MPSIYLSSGDYAAWGCPAATADQITRAGTYIDTYLQRPEGLAWKPDAAGAPAYMAALTPSGSYTLGGAISPGRNVTVGFPAAYVPGMADLIGEVVVLDRDDSTKVEACAIVGVNAQAGTVTLDRVLFAHAAGATAETGLTIVEERALPAKRSLTRASRFPMVRLIAGVGRYGYGRRTEQTAGLYNDVNLLATVQSFGGPPMWVPFDVSQASISVATGEIWVPAGQLLAYYSEVRIRYVAGFATTAVPDAIKLAVSRLVNKFAQFGDVDPMFKSVQAGGTKLELWAQSWFDDDLKAQLEPYRVKLAY